VKANRGFLALPGLSFYRDEVMQVVRTEMSLEERRNHQNVEAQQFSAFPAGDTII